MKNKANRPDVRRPTLTVDDYYEGVRKRNLSVVSRAITLVESNRYEHQLLAEKLLERLIPDTGNAIRLGISGAPGAGKSTFIEAIGRHLIARGFHVAVLAVDPSSGISGGSILGDKTRMPTLALEENAFIRPSPSGGTLGGVARKTRESLLVSEAAGFDFIIIETVGVGQSETLVANMTDLFLVLAIPGAGDELQGIKRGLLEFVDVIAVNKADGPNKTAAKVAAQQYVLALTSLAPRSGTAPSVLTCSALYNVGIEEILNVIEERWNHLKSTSELQEKRKSQMLSGIWTLVEEGLKQAVQNHQGIKEIRSKLEREVAEGNLTSEAAARKILEAFGISPRQALPT